METIVYDLNAACNGKLEAVLNTSHPEHNEVLNANCLTIKSAIWKDRTYSIIRYNKPMLNDGNVRNAGLFRSVIVCEGRIVSFSPPKSVARDWYSALDNVWDSTILEEFIEGTMVNVFNVDGEWEIATRSMVGANGRFFNDSGSNTFRAMFYDAMRTCGPASNLDDNGGMFAMLDPSYSYSFVFQHPENQIVTKVTSPELYLIRMYSIDGMNVTEYLPDSPEVIQVFRGEGDDGSKCLIDFPMRFPFTDYETLVEEWTTINRPHSQMGVVLFSKQYNCRSKIRNPSYEMVRHLRGNQPKLQYQYLELRSRGQVEQYLKHFPKARGEFSKYREQVHLFTTTLYSNYHECFVKKEKGLKEYPYQFKPHMFALHKLFIDNFKNGSKFFVSFSVVKDYVNNLPAAKLLYALNWHTRKNAVESAN